MDNASVAAAYVQRGWPVIALHDVTAGACSCQLGQYCDSAGKHPINRSWQLDYLSTAPQVYEAWARRPQANVGIVTGPPSGIWVLDVDPHHGGIDSLLALEAERGKLPKTYTVRTGSGGAHLYWALTNVDFDLTNSTGGKGRFPPGLDVRGRGGFVVAPPSVSGRGPYVALADPDLPHLVGPVAEAPLWMVERQRPKPYVRPEIRPGEDLRDGHGYALAAVRGELDTMAHAEPGTRNETAFKTGCRVYELAIAAWARLDFQQIEAGFLDACAAANVDGKFLDGEAWSVWLKVQRHVKEPAALPVARHLGHRVDWVDAVPLTENEQSREIYGEVAADPYELDVYKKMRELRIYEDARGRLDSIRFSRGWREPETYGDLAAELALPDETVAWRVGGLLPVGGNAVVIAPRKTGKTTLMGDLIRSLVDGTPFLGRFVVEPTSRAVALFNYENSRAQQRTWLRDLGITNTDRVHVLHLRGKAVHLGTPQIREWVSQWLRERDIGIWIPDPYLRAAQGLVLNENDNGQANIFTGVLDEIKEAAGVDEIVMPTHSSAKTEVDSGAETARGAGRIEDWADSLWYLTAVEGQRFFRCVGRDVDVDETQLHYDPASRSLSFGVAGYGRKEVKIAADAAEVAKALREWTEAVPATQRDLESATGFGNRRVAAAFKHLVDQDLAWWEAGPNRSKYHHLGQRPH